jgi:hypothetical protein
MRHISFKVSDKYASSEITAGLEAGRVYSIVGLICIKSESGSKGVPHCLAVVHNPYIDEDPRNNGEMWGKSFLKNTFKNSRFIDLIIKGFG